MGIEVISHSETFVVENDFLINTVEKKMTQCLKDKDHVVIPNSVAEIGNEAFYNCKSLESVVIPESVTKIGNNIFCPWKSSLKSIIIPKGKREYFKGLLMERYHKFLKEE